MLRLDETFYWMFEDDNWRVKFLVQGLILAIPVVGVIALLGWMMATYDAVRAGGQSMARQGFYLARGLRLLLVALFYYVAISIPYALVTMGLALVPDAALASVVRQVVNYLGLTLLAIVLVPILVATDRGGIQSGLDVAFVARSLATRPLRSLVVAAGAVLAGALGFLGFVGLLVGALFTFVYAAAVVASLAVWWAQEVPDAGAAEPAPDDDEPASPTVPPESQALPGPMPSGPPPKLGPMPQPPPH